MIYLKVTPQEGTSFEEFLLEYHQNPILQRFKIGIIPAERLYDREKIRELLYEKGQTSILKEEVLVEHIVSKGMPQNTITDILHKYLDKVAPDKELIIVDPYFFPKKFPINYSTFVTGILQRYLAIVDTLRIVTNSTFHNTVKSQITTDLLGLKPGLSIKHTISDDYHDRFWISNKREKGILLGSSLNGLGNKYALVDRLNTSDVRQIISELSNGGLI